MSTGGIAGGMDPASNVQGNQGMETPGEKKVPQKAEQMIKSSASLSQLREESPELYAAVLEGLAMQCGDRLQKHQERMKQIRKEAESNQG